MIFHINPFVFPISLHQFNCGTIYLLVGRALPDIYLTIHARARSNIFARNENEAKAWKEREYTDSEVYYIHRKN